MTGSIALEGVQIRRGGRVVVDQVSLVVEQGTWFGVIGANGSGKTSLLRAVAGRLPLTAGTCEFDGQDFSANRVARAERIGFAPPIESLPGTLRVREVLALVGNSAEQAMANMGPAAKALGLAGLVDSSISACSAGMRQRVSIAVALAGGLPTVILDEPFNWLDPVAAFDLKQALRAMVDAGLTLITALHDLSTLAHACNRGAMMTGGRIALMLEEQMLREAEGNITAFEARMIEALRH